MPFVVGIDPGLTSAGVFRYDEKGNSFSEVIGTDSTYGPRWVRYQHSMWALRDFLTPEDVVFMEDYNYGLSRKASSLVDMAEIGVLMKMVVLTRTGKWPFPVTISTLKKFLTGTGKGTKNEDLKLIVYKKYKMEFITTDTLIAFGLAQLGRCVLGLPPLFRDENWHGYELDSAQTVRKSLAKKNRAEELNAISKIFLRKVEKRLDKDVT